MRTEQYFRTKYKYNIGAFVPIIFLKTFNLRDRSECMFVSTCNSLRLLVISAPRIRRGSDVNLRDSTELLVTCPAVWYFNQLEELLGGKMDGS